MRLKGQVYVQKSYVQMLRKVQGTWRNEEQWEMRHRSVLVMILRL